MKQRLINHIRSLQDPALRRTCESILTYDKFLTWPASLSFHHAYEGGLLAHTVEVCDIALGIADIRQPLSLAGMFPVSDDILIAAALWHDVMKTEEYRLDPVFVDTSIKGTRLLIGSKGTWSKDDTRVRMFGHHEHIIASATHFQMRAYINNVNPVTIDAVTHCILAHHGRKEWGSPVEPQTVEALILHQSDMMSAKYGSTKDKAP